MFARYFDAGVAVSRLAATESQKIVGAGLCTANGRERAIAGLVARPVATLPPVQYQLSDRCMARQEALPSTPAALH